MVISVNTKEHTQSILPIFSPRKIIDREHTPIKRVERMKNIKKVQQGSSATPWLNMDCQLMRNIIRSKLKFQLTIAKGHNITNIAKYN